VFAFGQKLSALALHFRASVEESHGTAREKTTDSYRKTFPFGTETSTPLNPPGWVVFHPMLIIFHTFFVLLSADSLEKNKKKSLGPETFRTGLKSLPRRTCC
jgi:hypothetical protein